MTIVSSRLLSKLFSRNSVKRVRGLPYPPSRYFSAATASSTAGAPGLPLEKGEKLSEPSDSRMPSEKVQRLVEEIVSLSLLDVADLNKALKKRLNLPDAPMMMTLPAVAGSPAPAAASTEAATEAQDVPQKMTFSVKLTKFDDSKKIALIKEVRNAISGLNLVQAKKFVDSAPAVVKEDLGKTEAEELKAALEKAGGVCEII
uniref:39S ribosomal protein L12, mitochondrial n=1 Tax=Parascaris univalens TaxID=6257 RepID=A0A914ZJN1_PARUN